MIVGDCNVDGENIDNGREIYGYCTQRRLHSRSWDSKVTLVSIKIEPISFEKFSNSGSYRVLFVVVVREAFLHSLYVITIRYHRKEYRQMS